MSNQILKKAVMKFKTIEVEEEDGTSKIYKMALDMNAIAAALEDTGKDFASFDTWRNQPSSSEITKLFLCSLKRFHPEVTLEEVGRWLVPETLIHIQYHLFELAFPGLAEQIGKAQESTTQGE
jgi:hypothetical protein